MGKRRHTPLGEVRYKIGIVAYYYFRQHRTGEGIHVGT